MTVDGPDNDISRNVRGVYTVDILTVRYLIQLCMSDCLYVAFSCSVYLLLFGSSFASSEFMQRLRVK